MELAGGQVCRSGWTSHSARGEPILNPNSNLIRGASIQLQLSLSDGRKHNFLTAKAGNSLSCRL